MIYLRCLVVVMIILSTKAMAQSYLVQVRTENYLVLRSYLEQREYDIAGYNFQTKELGIVVSDPRLLEQLQIELSAQPLLSFSIISITPGRSYYEDSPQRDGIEGYYNVVQTVQDMQKMEELYPLWAKVYNLNQFLTIPATVEGRNIYAVQVSINPSVVEDEPKAMLIGLHHAREIMTHHAVLDAAWEFLKEAEKGNPQYRAWLENSAVWFVPVANPDGMEYVFNSNSMWRKNRSQNPDGSRGVDLNRNYEFLWGNCGSNSSSGSSDIYKGPSPQSEPEVKLMDKLNAKLHCQFIISYHSYGNEVLYPYRCASLEEANFYYMIRDALAKELNFGKRYASSSGEDFEQHYHHYGSIAFLLEIGTTFQPSFSQYRDTVWPVIKKVLPFILMELHKPHVYFKVTEASTLKPLPASISIQQISFKEGEKRTADEGNGSYRWFLLPGTYNVTVSMPGYQSKTFAINAGEQNVECHVQLTEN